MGSAARALVCSDLSDTAAHLQRIVASSTALQAIGIVRCRAEACEAMAREHPDLLVVDGRLGCENGLGFLQRVSGTNMPVLLVVEPGEEAHVKRTMRAQGREGIVTVSRALVERADAASDAVVRTRLCLLAASGRQGVTQRRNGATLHQALAPVLAAPFDAVVLVGSAGTPHLLPRLLPNARVAAAPLVVAVHHNPSFSADFMLWVGALAGRPPRPFDVAALATAGSAELFAAAATTSAPGAALGPDLSALLSSLARRGMRLLACVASGMDDPVADGLREVGDTGGRVVTLRPDLCAQPGLVLAAQAAGVVDAEVDLEEMAWLLRSARARG